MKNILNNKRDGAELILKERLDQVVKHGYTLGHDTLINRNGELLHAALFVIEEDKGTYKWPWKEKKIRDNILKKKRIDQLAIAGAFIAAEIDRLKHKEG